LIVNSILGSTFGVVIALLVDSLGRVILGLVLDRGPVLFHDRAAFTTGDNPLALAGGALAALLAGGLFLALYPGSRRHDASRLAVLWLILHSFRQGFVPLALTPVSPDSDFARALESLALPSGINVVLGAAGALGLLLVSLAAAPAFLAFAPTAKEIDTAPRRVAFVARIAVLPGVAGALLAVGFFLPDSGNGLIPTLPLFGLFTLATLLAAPGTRSVEPDQAAITQRFSWGLLITVVIAFLIFRFGLANGIPIPPDPDTFFLP
jgi:large-conductance mechanosensitive channel